VQEVLVGIAMLQSFDRNTMETFINCDFHTIHMVFNRKKAQKTHAKEALKDMIPPQDPVSALRKGERDLDELLDDSTET
jgi:hypothetical protein